jgi:hypothetical protein
MLGGGMTFRPEISDIFALAMDGRFKTSLAQKCSEADELPGWQFVQRFWDGTLFRRSTLGAAE